MSKFPNLKINFEDNGKTVTEDVPPYKKIKYLKEIAKKKFYPLKFDIQLRFQNKNISQNEDLIIGDVFKNQNIILIKIFENPENIKIPVKMNIQSEATQPIKLTNEEKEYFKCGCEKKLINNYCRKCKQLICNSCRINDTHKDHNVIQINPYDLNESCKLYSIILQGEISNNIKNSQNYKLKFKKKKFTEFSSRHEDIQKKYDQIYEKYQEVMKNIDIDPENNEINIDKLINEYKEKTNSINQELDEITNNLFTEYIQKRKRMKSDKFDEILDKLSKKDSELENCSKDIINYNIYYKITEKLNKMHDEIEKTLDYYLNSKTLFDIDKESNILYEKIKKNKNNENNENEENNSNSEKHLGQEEKEISENNEKIYTDKEEVQSDRLAEEDN